MVARERIQRHLHRKRRVVLRARREFVEETLRHGRSLEQHTRLVGVERADMVGTLNSDQPGVLLEGAPVSQGLLDELTASAQDYTTLAVEVSLNPFASDHVPFINAGLPAALTIEGMDSANTHVHSSDDTLDKISYPLSCEI